MTPSVLDRFRIATENDVLPKPANSGGVAEIGKSLEIRKNRFKEHRTIATRAGDEAQACLRTAEAASACSFSLGEMPLIRLKPVRGVAPVVVSSRGGTVRCKGSSGL